MKISFVKALAMATIMFSLAFGNVVYASFEMDDDGENAVESSVDGESSVKELTYKVLLPTTYTVVLNPMAIADAHSQYSTSSTSNQIEAPAPFTVMNLTDIPIELRIKAAVETAPDVLMLASNAPVFTSMGDMSKYDATFLEKYAYAEIAVASMPSVAFVGHNSSSPTALSYGDITMTGWSPYATGTAVGNTAAADLYSTKSGVVPLNDVLGDPSELVFYLVASEGGALITKGGVTSFTVQGKLNPAALWKAGDIKMNFKYVFNGVPKTTFGDKFKNISTQPMCLDSVVKGTELTSDDRLVSIKPSAGGVTAQINGVGTTEIRISSGKGLKWQGSGEITAVTFRIASGDELVVVTETATKALSLTKGTAATSDWRDNWTGGTGNHILLQGNGTNVKKAVAKYPGQSLVLHVQFANGSVATCPLVLNN